MKNSSQAYLVTKNKYSKNMFYSIFSKIIFFILSSQLSNVYIVVCRLFYRIYFRQIITTLFELLLKLFHFLKPNLVLTFPIAEVMKT